MSEPSAVWRVYPLQVPDLPPFFEVPPAGLVLGRDEGAGVVLSADRFPGVSSRHARVSVEDGRVRVEDLASRNGTLVGGQAVERRELDHGEVFELGPGGPRFMVLTPARMGSTVVIPRAGLTEAGPRRSIGTETVRLVRERLGLPERGVEHLEKRSRANLAVTLALLALLAATGVWAYLQLSEDSQRSAADLAARTQELERRVDVELAGVLAAVEAERSERTRALERAAASWEADRDALEEERADLEETIERLEQGELSAEDELAELRDQLAETTQKLELYDPVNLQRDRLSRVSRVEACTVLVEANQSFREVGSGVLLYLDERGGRSHVNLEFEGEPLRIEATGSGFCISPEGWIVTNAHVVHKKREDMELRLEGLSLVAEDDLAVVFSGQSLRHPARLVAWANDEKEDLALLKIEPFEGMPHLDGLDLELAPPRRGEEVFLLGFPLGKRVLHSGDTMIASAFKGIVSRSVGYYLQVDAAVHPGASGGPVIDGQGRVRGVVVGMQTLDETATSSAIGYVIPVAEVAKVWPAAEPGQ